jgi:outer membrane protein OmpA-like peptidoglycan-associated protein
MKRLYSHSSVALVLASAALAHAQEPAQHQVESSTRVTTSIADDASRKAALSTANTLEGGTGLLRVISADSGPPGTFRISATGTFYTGTGLLCPRCNNIEGETLSGKDKVGYSATRLQASITPLDFLEAFGAMRFRSVSNDHGAPQLIQISGDTMIGAKAFLPPSPGRIFTIGAGPMLSLLAKNRSIGPSIVNVDFTAASTLDFRELSAKSAFPLRLHANLGYRFDNTGKIADDIESSRAAQASAQAARLGRPSTIAPRITRIERFGFGINRSDALRFGIGGEWVFTYARPFAEWSIDVPMNRQDYKCRASQVTLGDTCLDRARQFSALPSRLSFGVRGYPWLNSWAEGVMLLAAVDVGTGATARFVEEVMPELPWAISVGLGYAAGAKPRVEVQRVVEEKKVEVVQLLPPELYVRGKVTEKDSPTPVAGVAVQFKNSTLPGVLTDETGAFRTFELAPGKYMLQLSKEGFATSECEVTVMPAAEPQIPNANASKRAEFVTEVACSLPRLPAVAVVTGVLRDAESTQFVARARVTVSDPKGRKLNIDTDEYGGFRFENVPAGKVRVQVESDAYLPAGAEIEVKARENVTLQLSLHKRPKQPSLTLTKNELKLKRQIHFMYDSAEILPDSMGLVEEIAETLRARPDILQIEIQGHTDNLGTADHNQTLSAKRAAAVRDALILIGVPPNRLTAHGYGQEKPVAPNTTEANRAKNRRVQFVILDR